MGVLSNLEPKRVFHYFEEISKIPHGSYHEKEISDYLVDYAKEHGFSVFQDELFNVVMLIPASEGYETEEPVILQGHMDMVCEKNAVASINMEKDGLNLAVDGDYIYAKETTLGGDDGIAIAYMLAIADDKTIAHPPLEYIITVCEEVGLEGAKAIDLSMLKGHKMLNLDSEEEGIFLTSCAGGVSALTTLPVVWENASGLEWFEVSVSGLTGGHSGCEIHKGRANANKVLGRTLNSLRQRVDFSLQFLEGGQKDNAIPVYARAVLGMEAKDTATAKTVIAELAEILKSEYMKSDKEITLAMCECKEDCSGKLVLDDESLSKVLTVLMCVPDGVQGMSMSVPGLVETSLNLGILKLTEEHLFTQHAIRSSVSTKKAYVADQLDSLLNSLGGRVEQKGEYPAWEYREESAVRQKVISLFEKMYGKAPIVEGIHAGLECGILSEKIKGLDCISMGPDILDIHTTSERLSISSAKRVYDFLIEFLRQR